MSFRLSVEISESVPALGWVMRLSRRSPAASVITGTAVENVAGRIIAGAWAGPFPASAMGDAVTSIGTSIETHNGQLVVVCGTAGADILFAHYSPGGLTIGNSLSLVLAAADDRPRHSYPFYSNDLFSIHLGGDRYRKYLSTVRGTVSIHFASFGIDSTLRLTPRSLPPAPPFADYAAYRSFLVQQTAAVFANAADPARRIHYRSIAGASAGYDSPAAAVIARDAGCRESFTFEHSLGSRGDPDDSGEAIARSLGLTVRALPTFAYRERTDHPELKFASAGFGGGDVYLTGCEDYLRNRIVVGGGGGDRIWSALSPLPPWYQLPTYLGGYTATKFFLELPALTLAVPAIGITSYVDIGRISRSAEMQPWSVGGPYDRPIVRRIIEEAGTPRGSFAKLKRRVSPIYEEPRRKIPPLSVYLSANSMAAFEGWFAQLSPSIRAQNLLRNLAEATLGRLLWSKKVSRWIGKLRLRWPPAPGRFWQLRAPVRRSAYVFHWAIEREIDRYKTDLTKERRRG